MDEYAFEELIGIGFYLVLSELQDVKRELRTIKRLEREGIMDLERLTASVAAQTDVITSAQTLLGELSSLIRNAVNDPVALAAIADQVDANSAQLAAAVTENTPAAPPA
jgi:hypothetical protein